MKRKKNMKENIYEYDISDTPTISGIDALYYFAQSGAFYDRFYESIVQKIERRRKEFEAFNYAYKDNDIIIDINGIEVAYSGRSRDGFDWFAHESFRLGLKDSEQTPNIHNIRVQLNAMGIYTIGLKSLLDFIQHKVLKGVTTGHFPITRIDLNSFVQHDFRYLRSEMISSRKKSHHANIAEHTKGYELETFYVGKKPFLLRIYNKKRELATVKEDKRLVMYNHFGINGLERDGPIFNVEFEMHRTFLKEYGIDTIEDAIARADILFKKACDLIRLIDVESISAKTLDSANRNRAKTLPIWQHIRDAYAIDGFLQLDTPLEKIAPISVRYSLEDAAKAIKRVLQRLRLHGNAPTFLFLLDVYQDEQEEYALRDNIVSLHQRHSEDEDLSRYSDEGLQRYEERMAIELDESMYDDELYETVSRKHNVILEELERRGLSVIPF